MIHITKCPICSSESLEPYLTTRDFSFTQESFTVVVCKACSFKMTSPRPTNEQLAKYYETPAYVSHNDQSTSIVDRLYRLARTFTLRWKARLIGSYATNKTLLDFGCGTGEFINYMKSKSWRVTGVEPSPVALAAARSKVGTENVIQSIETLSDQYDIITLWHVLEHIPDLNTLIQLLKIRLTKNGRLVVALPNPDSQDQNYYKESWAAYDVPRHLWHFNKQNVRQLFSNHGLKIEKIEPMKLDAYYIALMSESYQRPTNNLISNATAAIINGTKSNAHAKRSMNYSSLIYILKHEQ